MKKFIKNLFSKIKHHFNIAKKGKEDLVIVLWVWGGVAYILSFFINKIIIVANFMLIKWIIAILVIIYFIWHIIIIKKCSPQKTLLSKDEKKRLKKDRTKRFLRKLFLKEPITKWNPSLIATIIDLYIIIHFANYLI